jgi:hypothetical protein
MSLLFFYIIEEWVFWDSRNFGALAYIYIFWFSFFRIKNRNVALPFPLKKLPYVY